MARRRTTKRKTTRKRSKSINVVGTAESIVLANAVTSGLFGSNLFDFITGSQAGQFKAGVDGATRITLPELAGFKAGGGWSASNIGGSYTGSNVATGLGSALKYNFGKNAVPMISTLVLVPIAFRVGSKLLAKPRREANKLLKMSGIGSMVKV